MTTGSLTSSESPTSEFFLGIGPGGMENMIAYPALIWLTLFSGHIIALSSNHTKREKD